MVTTPWRQFRTLAPDREYLALASFLPLRRFAKMIGFVRFAREVGIQLESTPGLIGYSFHAKPFRKQFWTLSLWEDDASLAAFVRAAPHGRIMAVMQGEMGETKFVRWRVSGSASPPTWGEGLRRLAGGHPSSIRSQTAQSP